MSQDNQKNSIKNCKCAKCKFPLVDPVQLPACLHILCKKCVTDVESNYLNNINCPKCGQENGKPSILNRISGIELSANGGGYVPCDFEPSHENAMWNCFLCAKNLCRLCRGNHPFDHGDCISLLPTSSHIRLLYEENLDATGSFDFDSTDGSLCSSLGILGGIGENCAVCGTTSCSHIDDLELLHAQPDAEKALCEISSHRDIEGHSLQNNYFCINCWKPVCGDCSQKGEHKHHKCKDLESMREHLRWNLSELRCRISILLAKTKQDQEDQKEENESLRKHVDSMSKEMDQRRCKALEGVTQIFNRGVDDAECQGKDIMRIYQREADQTSAIYKFLNVLYTALNLEVEETLNTAQYISIFNNMETAENLIEEMRKIVMERERPKQLRLVLCNSDMFRPCQESMASVGRECRQPSLAFSFKLNNEIKFVHSIFVKGSDQCFLSCEMVQERKNDAILCYEGESSNPKERVIEVLRGRYYLARMVSGEIVASYSNGYENAIKYFESEELLLKQEEFAKFNDTKKLNFEPRGIAATKQNTILLCATLQQEKKGFAAKPSSKHDETSYLMLMSVMGKVLEEVQHEATDTLSPNCVAVNDNGDVCVCDPNNSTIAILDSKLRLKERVKYCLPTSLSRYVLSYISSGKSKTDPDLTFRPEGVCFDRYGRIIVADSNNNMVVRLSKSVSDKKYHLEPLIFKTDSKDLKHFRFPKLVALGEDGRLWVVCQEYVFVFDYGI